MYVLMDIWAKPGIFFVYMFRRPPEVLHSVGNEALISGFGVYTFYKMVLTMYLECILSIMPPITAQPERYCQTPDET